MTNQQIDKLVEEVTAMTNQQIDKLVESLRKATEDFNAAVRAIQQAGYSVSFQAPDGEFFFPRIDEKFDVVLTQKRTWRVR